MSGRDFKSVYLMQTYAGEGLDKTCEEALNLAKYWGQTVVFEFNHRFMYAKPHDRYSDLISRYNAITTNLFGADHV